MNYQSVLFDLDGTICDSSPGVLNGLRYALDKFGIHEMDDQALMTHIGPPLSHTFKDVYGFSDADTQKAISFHREYYAEKGVYENSLFPGMEELFQQLCNAGVALYIATSKAQHFTDVVVRHFNIYPYFKDIVGSTSDGSLVEKDEIIRFILEKHNPEKERTIMVGDRKFDITGARVNGIDSIWVEYGYGTVEERDAAAPTFCCALPEDIFSVVTKVSP